MKTRPIVFEANRSGCLEVISHRQNRGGYPLVTVHGITQGAHRHVYEECFGPIPHGQYVLHRCDNRRCANPEHLFLGTKGANNRDRDLKGRQARGERNAHAKLTAQAIREIRRRYRPGDPRDGGRALARQFGVSHTTVRYVTARKAWAWLA